jgi:hypothetical protein
VSDRSENPIFDIALLTSFGFFFLRKLHRKEEKYRGFRTGSKKGPKVKSPL